MHLRASSVSRLTLHFFRHLLLYVLACVIGVGYRAIPEVWTVALPYAIGKSSHSVGAAIRTGRTYRALEVFKLAHHRPPIALLAGAPDWQGPCPFH